MIMFRKGNTRIGLILFKWLVIKFPNPRFDSVKHSWGWRVKRKKGLHRLKGICLFPFSILKILYEAFCWGVAGNISEALNWLQMRDSSYASPVFSLGLLSFSFYEGDEIPTHEELQEFLDSFSEHSKEYLMRSDSHALDRHNWRKTKRGIVTIDYGANPLRDPFLTFVRLMEGDKRKQMQQV